MNRQQSGKIVILAMLGSFAANTIWGFSSSFTKMGMQFSAPSVLLTWRFVVAFIALSIYAAVRGIDLRLRGRALRYLPVLGLFQPVLYFIMEEYGILYSSAAFCGIMLSLSPAISLLMGAVCLREKTTWAQLAFSALSISGVLIVTLASGGTGIVTVLGAVLLFGAVAFGTAYFIVSRHIADMITSFQRTYYMVATGALVFPLWAMLENRQDLSLMIAPLKEPNFLVAILFLSVLSTVLAYLGMNYAASYLPAARYSAFTNLSTIFAILAGVLIHGEPFLPVMIPTTVMIIVGVWGVQKFTPEALEAWRQRQIEREGQ